MFRKYAMDCGKVFKLIKLVLQIAALLNCRGVLFIEHACGQFMKRVLEPPAESLDEHGASPRVVGVDSQSFSQESRLALMVPAQLASALIRLAKEL